MISYADCLNKRTTFKIIFEQAEECGISSSIDDGPANEILQSISQTHFDPAIKKKISFITVNIDFFKMCKEIKKGNINDYIEDNMFCSYWLESKLDEEYMFVEDTIGEKI